MVVQRAHDDDVDRLFRALADGTRRDIVRRVLLAEESVSDLAARYEMSFAAVQKHVAVLQRAGLVTKERRGREQIVRGDVEATRAVRDVLDGYEALWRARTARMAALLADDEKGTTA